MTVNQLMSKLRTEQKAGNGSVEVHFLAHDNCEGETQGCVFSVRYYEKDAREPANFGGRDANLYNCLPDKVVYIM